MLQTAGVFFVDRSGSDLLIYSQKIVSGEERERFVAIEPANSGRSEESLDMKKDHLNFSRRERQIMDVIYKLGQATAAEVLDNLPDPPGYSTVRTLLGVLERKGHLRHERQGYHYVYFPTAPVEKVSASMLQHVMNTFYDGSATRVVSALLDISDSDLSQQEYDEILNLVEKARQEGH